MFTRTFHPDRFLRTVYGTPPFMEYCRRYGIAVEQPPEGPLEGGDYRRWTAALGQLPKERQAEVELDLAKVNELSGRDAVEHLMKAAAGTTLPAADIPGGCPLALWFLLHQPEIFHEVFLHHEIRELRSWHHAQAEADIELRDLPGSAEALAGAVRAFFRLHDGASKFCTVDPHPLRDAVCFVVQVADRLQFIEGFTDQGEPALQRVRPAVPVLFVYYPSDGTVLLKSHLRATDRVRELFQAFGRAVLGVPVQPGDAFNLDLLKAPFHPLPDAEDIEQIRVKALHLRYPASAGGRQIKLTTLARDEATAIDRLLAVHAGTDGLLGDLHVSHAELQVRLRVSGRSRNVVIRLWPDRCSLNQTDLGERLRRCLKRWNIAHV